MNTKIRWAAKCWEPSKNPMTQAMMGDQFNSQKFAKLIINRIIDTVDCMAYLFNTKEARELGVQIVKSIRLDFKGKIRTLAAECWEPSKNPMTQSMMGDQFNSEKFADLIINRIIDNIERHADLFNTKEARKVCDWTVKSIRDTFESEE